MNYVGLRFAAGQELIGFLLGTGTGIAIAGLQQTNELVVITLDLGNVVVGQLAPLLLHFALDLVPLALQNITVDSHSACLGLASRRSRSATGCAAHRCASPGG